MPAWPPSDLALSRRLERTEAEANASFVETRARLSPETGACWIEVAGTYAMFDTPTSPLTQTFGLGVCGEAKGAELERLEAFFKERQAPVFHEVSPLADPALLPLLSGRGYRPIELTSVMYRPLERGAEAGVARDGRVRVRLAETADADVWASTSARGWSETPELGAFMLEIGRVVVLRRGGLSFLAESEGRPIAAGAMSIHDGVALLAGAATIPEARRQGAQLALLEARLRLAAERGCDLAMMCALPGSASQRNAERHGFRIAYTRLKWTRD